MIGPRLFRRLGLALCVLVLANAGIVLVIITPPSEREALRHIEDSLEARARLLGELVRPSLSGEARPDLGETIRGLADRTGTRYTVIRADGTVLADSRHDPALMERHDRRPEIRDAAEGEGPGTVTRHSRTVGQDMLYLALAVRDGDRLLGFVRSALPTTAVSERRALIRNRVFLAAGVAAVAAIILGLALTLPLTRRLASMAKAAQNIAEQRTAGPLPITARDETGDLARAIARLDEQLRERLEALSRERNQLQAVFASMAEGVVAVDRSEEVVHMNLVAADLLQTTPAQSVGRRIWEVTRVQEICEALGEALRDDSSHEVEVRLPGQPRDISLQVRASPLHDSSSVVVGAVVVLRDVTELRRLERVRRDFVANVSHELKTPLTAIRGLVETMIEDNAMDEETRRRFLGKSRNQAMRLSSLVTDLLILSKIESDEEPLERQGLDLCATLRESSRRLDPTALGRRVTVRVTLPSKPVDVLAEDEAIRQIVDNLLDNALKYTGDDGAIHLSLRVDDDRAIVEVKDTGIGIAPEHLDRIFERFYRVDKARSRALGGTGLGLAIVKHLVEALRGAIEVESRPGEGSSFRVSLPLAEPPDDA